MEEKNNNMELIELTENDYTVVNVSDYSPLEEFVMNLPDIAHPLMMAANEKLGEIQELLNKSPALINVIKSLVPEETLVAVLSDQQKMELAKGALELMTKKDGSLMAILRDPNTKQIVQNLNLQSIKFTPEIGNAMADFSSQMQIAQLTEEVRHLQIAVEKVQQGLESDRLATAYSLQQKYKLACSISNPQLKQEALLRITMDAEDSRNRLMLNQANDLQFIMSQPQDTMGKLLASIKTKDNDRTINTIRSSMLALNMVSVVEALAYQSLGESNNAVLSLEYYGDFMKKTYGNQKFMLRLDELDPADENFWSEYLPEIKNKILELPKKEWFKYLSTNTNQLLLNDKEEELE